MAASLNLQNFRDHKESRKCDTTKGTEYISSNWPQRNGDSRTSQQRIKNNYFKDAQGVTRDTDNLVKSGKHTRIKWEVQQRNREHKTKQKFGAEYNDWIEEFNSFNIRLDQTEERISELKNISFKIIQSEE